MLYWCKCLTRDENKTLATLLVLVAAFKVPFAFLAFPIVFIPCVEEKASKPFEDHDGQRQN